MAIRIKDWSKFQHFKDRRPPWIKLYRDILDDPEWFELNPHAAKILVMLWVMASDNFGVLPDIKKISFRLRIPQQDVSKVIIQLKHWLEYDDISEISARYQVDAPEKRREETEGETEGEKNKEISKTKSPRHEVALIELPVFVSADSWFGFIEMRKKIKKPITERACQLLIKKLTMFHNTGHDVNAILDQSTVNSWQDLYEIKPDYQSKRKGPVTFHQQQVENIKQAMQGALNDEAGLAGIQFIDG